MRIPILVAVALTWVSVSCSSGPAPVTASEQLSCSNGTLATVSNLRTVSYDVLYQEGRKAATMIGDVPAGTTTTFSLPGTGQGRVYGRARNGYIPRNRAISDFRIRVHCAA